MVETARIPDDQHTTVSEIRAWMRQFVEERQWQDFHNGKNLAMSLAIEAGELMEHFQWLTSDQVADIDRLDRAGIAEEMADVACYLVSLTNALEIDLAGAIHLKMIKNRRKYPAGS